MPDDLDDDMLRPYDLDDLLLVGQRDYAA
jgi:hypothetical protein